MDTAPLRTTLIVADTKLMVTGAIGTDTVPTGSCLLDHITALPRKQAADICRVVLDGGSFEWNSKFFRTSVPDPSSDSRVVVVIGPKHNAQGVLEGVVYADLKVERAAQMVERPSAELFESMVENAVDTIYLLDSNGILTFVNRQVESYQAISVDSVVGRHFSEIVHPDDVFKCSEIIARTIAEKTPVVDFEYRVPLPDGTLRYFVANGRFVQDGDRSMVMGIGRDVTESVMLKERLAAMHRDLTDRVERLAMLERLARSVNAERDVREVLAACMREVESIVGYDLGVVVLLKPDREAHIFPFGRDGAPQPMTKLRLSDQQMRNIESIDRPVLFPQMQTKEPIHVRAATFKPKHGSGAALPLMSMGRMFGLLKVWSEEPNRYDDRDIQILQSVAEHLSIAAYNAVLYESEQSRALEMAALAQEARHRVKNNLQMISGLLSMSIGGSGGYARAVERCLRQVGAIAAVHDLLDSNDMSAQINLHDCLARIAHGALQATGRSDCIELIITGDDCFIPSDCATAVGVIINELVSNAVEHGFRGRERGRIEVRVRHGETECCVEVIDDGNGLPADFVMPAATDTTTGLGVVAALARHGLNGVLEIESTGQGACARMSVKGV